MKKAFIYIPVFLLVFTPKSFTQNLFEEVFEGCKTERFVIEKDSIKVKIKGGNLINILAKNFDERVVKEIRGVLSFQVIVDLQGNSCLLSADNETNIKTEQLNLKNIIDNNLKWYKPKEKTSVILAIKFYGNEVELKRIGLNAEKGFHQLIN